MSGGNSYAGGGDMDHIIAGSPDTGQAPLVTSAKNRCISLPTEVASRFSKPAAGYKKLYS
jgi:hypothetical protein